MPGAGELCQREGGGGERGEGYGREMHVGEMVAVLVGRARRKGQQEVTCSIPLSAQLSLGRYWAEPMAPSPPLSCPPGQGRKRKEARKEGCAAVQRRALQRWGQLLGSSVLLSQSLQGTILFQGQLQSGHRNIRVPFWIPGLSSTVAGGMAWKEHTGWKEKEGD